MIQKLNSTGPSPITFRNTALVLLFAVLSLLTLAFGSLVLDPFPPSAPPM